VDFAREKPTFSVFERNASATRRIPRVDPFVRWPEHEMTVRPVDPGRNDAARLVATFSLLIHAWQMNDFSEAARAREELEYLGVKVRILRRSSATDEGGRS
jgi:hypothetical protein